MSTKINARSPFYLKFSEPALPSVALTCSLINLQGFAVDEFGNVTLPDSDYGTIASYTSTVGDFSNGKFAAVGSATSRTVTFAISIPTNFSNSAAGTINCNATASQPATVCSGGITNNGSIPNQAVDTDGDTATITLSSYFTGGTVTQYLITNNNLDFFTHSLNNNTLTIIGTKRAGVKNMLVEASDGDVTHCKATQTIQITTTAQVTYACSDAYFSGGSIAQNGTIVNPTVNGTITAIRSSSGGSAITSYSANTTGSDRDVTLYFVITVPTGYSNASASVECSKTFSQPTAALPTFTCSIASLTNQAVYSSGSIVKGIADVGTITSFSPISFGSITSDTSRTVTYSITPPASGYSNSGGSDISCDITMTQPSIKPTAGTNLWYTGGYGLSFMTKAQFQAVLSNVTALALNFNTYEGALEANGVYDPKQKITRKASTLLLLASTDVTSLVNTYAFLDRGTGNPYLWQTLNSNSFNPTGGVYWRITKIQEQGAYIQPAFLRTSHFMKLEPSGLITEIWFVDWIAATFTKIA